MRTPKLVTALNGVTATTTSEPVDVREAEKVTLLFTRSNHGSGSSTFTVQGSIDNDSTGVFEPLNILIDNVTNTNTGTLTRVASCALSSDDSKLYALDLTSFGFTFIKITVTEVTDGTHTAKVLVEY